MPAESLVLSPNVPQMVALRYPTPKVYPSTKNGGSQAYYSLMDGRTMLVDLGVSRSIENLQLGNGEPFHICRYWNGEASQPERVNVWLTPEGEKIRAQDEVPVVEANLRNGNGSKNGNGGSNGNGAGVRAAPPCPIVPALNAASTPNANPGQIHTGWAQFLLQQTNQLVDCYAEACRHADRLSVPHAVVRTLLISAFINVSRRGGADTA